MRQLRILCLMILLFPLLGLPRPAVSEPVFSPGEKKAIEEIIAEYLRSNPEIIAEAIRILRRKQVAEEESRRRQAVVRNRQKLEHDPGSPVAGNPNGDVTIVEFFDYRCPYCKAVAPAIRRLVEEDGKIRLVYKEWPILGPESEYASRAALAAARQGKYLAFHEKVIGQKQVTEESVQQAARELGLDLQRLRRDMYGPEVEKQLQDTARLADELGISGTPAFVIGDHLIPGMASSATLRALIERARRKGAS